MLLSVVIVYLLWIFLVTRRNYTNVVLQILRGVLFTIIMPINNIQFRAEIGCFNNVLCAFFATRSPKISNDEYMLSLLVFILKIFFTFTVSKVINILCYIYFYFCVFLYSIVSLLRSTTFHQNNNRYLIHYLTRYLFFFQVCIFLPYIKLSLAQCGDIESNPGPQDNTDHNLSICHWNLNGLATNNYIKLSLLEAFNTVHDFDIICLGETFLNSENSNDNPRLKLQGYAMVRSDHPQNLKRGGVCILYKEHLPFVLRNDITFLNECIVGEINVNNSKFFITCVYRSPFFLFESTELHCVTYFIRKEFLE